MIYPEAVEVSGVEYEINTSWEDALACFRCINDPGISDTERGYGIIAILYKDMPDDLQEALRMAVKYLQLGKEPGSQDADSRPDMDFKEDMHYIRSSFRSDYTSPYFEYTYYDAALQKKYDVWLASWDEFPDFAAPPTKSIWQYTDDGTVSGITGDVDMNVTYRDYATIIKNAGLNNLTVAQPTEDELAVAWAVAQHISDGERLTADAIRQEVITMLYRALHKEENT